MMRERHEHPVLAGLVVVLAMLLGLAAGLGLWMYESFACEGTTGSCRPNEVVAALLPLAAALVVVLGLWCAHRLATGYWGAPPLPPPLRPFDQPPPGSPVGR